MTSADTPKETLEPRLDLYALFPRPSKHATTHVPTDVFEEAAQHFSDHELAVLILAITMINAWNRLAISTGQVAGNYQPGAVAARSWIKAPAGRSNPVNRRTVARR